MKDYISIDNGILLKGQLVIDPASMRDDVLSHLHDKCHQGVEKTRLLARRVGSCCACSIYMNSKRNEPMCERDLPTMPWEMLGSDLFDYHGHKYLLVSDYYSKFPFVR